MTKLSDEAKQQKPSKHAWELANEEASDASTQKGLYDYPRALALRIQAELDAPAKREPDGVVTEWHREQMRELVIRNGHALCVPLTHAATVLAQYVPAPEPERDPDLDRAKEIYSKMWRAGFPQEPYQPDEDGPVIAAIIAALKEVRNNG